MKVAKKSPQKRPTARRRATLTLDIETYRRIDALRGESSRAGWVQALIREEEDRQERQQFVDAVNASFTPEVCRKTLLLNDELPIHEE